MEIRTTEQIYRNEFESYDVDDLEEKHHRIKWVAVDDIIKTIEQVCKETQTKTIGKMIIDKLRKGGKK